jgi:hypothetical protein
MNQQNKPIQQKVNIDLSQADAMKCAECGCERFQMQYLIRKVSALLSPTGDEVIIPVQIFSCANCGIIPEDFLPSN